MRIDWQQFLSKRSHNSLYNPYVLAAMEKNPDEKPSVWRYLLIGTAILFMPLTRMIMGAHFLSDTAMGFLITYGCYLYYRQFFRKRGYL